MSGRNSQEAVLPLGLPTTSTARDSQESLTTLGLPTTPGLPRVSQDSQTTLLLPTTPGLPRVSQDVILVVQQSNLGRTSTADLFGF